MTTPPDVAGGGARTSSSNSSRPTPSPINASSSSISASTSTSTTASRPRPSPAPPARRAATVGEDSSSHLLADNETDRNLMIRMMCSAADGDFAKIREVMDKMQYVDPGRWSSRIRQRTLRMTASVAARFDQREIAKYLINNYDVAVHGPPSDMHNVRLPERHDDLNYNTPLGNAIKMGHEDLALELLALPAADKLTLSDLCFGMEDDFTLLHFSVLKGCERVCRDLLRRGGDALEMLEACTKKLGMPPLDLAMMGGHVSIARLLLKKYEEKGQLRRALNREWAREGWIWPVIFEAIFRSALNDERITEASSLAMVQFLIREIGADPRAECIIRLKGGSPGELMPIHRAASLGLLSIVKCFAEECDQSVNDVAGARTVKRTPLHCVALERTPKEEDLLKVAEYLVERGANVLAKNGKGQTPASAARANGRQRLYEYLAGKEREAEVVGRAAAEEAAAAAAAELLMEEEEEKGGGGGGGGATQKKKRNRNRKKGRGGSRGDGGGAGAAGGGGEGAEAGQKLEAAMEGLDLDEDGKEGEEKEEAQAEEEIQPPPPPSYTTTATTLDEYLLEDAPESYICSITLNLLTSPVLAADGFVYSEDGLRGWIETCKSKGKEITSPKTNAKMADFMIVNQTHRTLVLEYAEKKEAEWKIICEEREAREEQQGKGMMKK